jgi:hypothetical protein
METKDNLLEPLIERIEQYGKTSFELLRLQSIEKVANTSSALISRIILILALLFFLLSINTAVALWLGDLLGKAYYGFFIIGFCYGLLGIILYLIHPKVKARINNSIITNITKASS